MIIFVNMFSLILGLPKCKRNVGRDPSLGNIGFEKFVKHGLTCYQARGQGPILKKILNHMKIWVASRLIISIEFREVTKKLNMSALYLTPI